MANVSKINGYDIKDSEARETLSIHSQTLEDQYSKLLEKTYCFDSILDVSNSDIVEGDIFILKGYDTIFKVVSDTTISSLQINDGLYADVISTTAIIDSLGITSTIDPELFAEIVEYARNKGIELIFLHKTYTLNSSITLVNANKLKLSGLGYDSVINYTGVNYAFIINSFQQSQFYNFTINCTNNGGGIYFTYLTGQSQTNLITCSKLERVYIYDSKNPIKLDCHFGYFTIKNCILEVGTTDGIGIDISDAYYPEFLNIEENSIRTIYRDSANTGVGILMNSGVMINIINNDIIGFYYGIHLDASESNEQIRTINLHKNSYWDCLNKAIYMHATSNNKIKEVSIKDSSTNNSLRNDTLDYAIHIANCYGICIDNIAIMQLSTHQVYLSDTHIGHVRNVYTSNVSSLSQANNQIGDDIEYEFINRVGLYTVPANGSVNVNIGSEYNLRNFRNYMLVKRGADNVSTGLTATNQSITGGKITLTLNNSTSSNINVNIYGI